MSQTDDIRKLIARWRADEASTYRTWFLWEDRLKNFRSIRSGIAEVVREIQADAFGNVYKGSSLETIVGSIAEQRQMFKGADHAFLWKPKLRIPDIYENRPNQIAFGQLLDTCACCSGEDQIIRAVHQIDGLSIKGLGPAVANLLYFLHPTIVPPFNTAIVNGYNALTGAKVKLGRWTEYLAMRQGVLGLNSRYRDLLSNDLGAVAAFLFDLGAGRYPVPPRNDDEAARARWEADLAKLRQDSAQLARQLSAGRDGDRTHTEIQGWLRDLGRALGFGVWIAANDHNRAFGGGRLIDGCLPALPAEVTNGGAESIRLIDVMWLDQASGRVAAAFEVEHTTSIYSGIVRLLDLALGGDPTAAHGLYLVAPDDREADVRAQLARPAFSRIGDLRVRYLPYSELERHRDAMARFGQGLKPVEAVSRLLR